MRKILWPMLLVLFFVTALAAQIQVWPHPYLKPMQRSETPPPDGQSVLSLATTPGEYEPTVFAVRGGKDEKIKITLVSDTGTNPLPESWCQVQVVAARTDSTPLNRLYDITGKEKLTADRTSFFWLTVRPPAGTAAGEYRAALKVRAGKQSEELQIICRVLPFRLEPSPVTGGVFMSSTDIPESWYADMKEHGLNSIQFFWGGTGIQISRDGNNLALDFSRMDSFMHRVTAAGLSGPVIISLGNDHSLHYERRIAEAFDFPVITEEKVGNKAVIGPAITPELDRLFVDGLRQIRAHWESMSWPQELVVLIYDEPTERLLDRCKNRYDLLKKAMPDYKVYGVVMNRGSWAASMADQCDVIVSDGDFLGCQDVAAKFGKDYWVYSFPMRNVHTMRYDMGCLPWRVQAQGAFFWMYNYWSYNPDGCAVYQHPENSNILVHSTGWEGAREGMDDLRYFATAQRMIDRAPATVQPQARSRLYQIRNGIDPNRRKQTPTGEAHDELSVLEHYSQPQSVRDEVIKLILDLL
ncbi:glycoside hydrolase domain-containing protein [Gemmatimonadota bacterium]